VRRSRAQSCGDGVSAQAPHVIWRAHVIVNSCLHFPLATTHRGRFIVLGRQPGSFCRPGCDGVVPGPARRAGGGRTPCLHPITVRHRMTRSLSHATSQASRTGPQADHREAFQENYRATSTIVTKTGAEAGRRGSVSICGRCGKCTGRCGLASRPPWRIASSGRQPAGPREAGRTSPASAR
jgi:hypothetical protein